MAEVEQPGLQQGGINEPLNGSGLEEAGVSAGIPNDLGFAPVFPDACHLLAGMDQAIGDPQRR